MKIAAAIGLVILLAASLAIRQRQPANSDRALLAGAQLTPAVRTILERSCRDCHSEATRYPWYTVVAPVSLLIYDDVRQGREHLNFSRWDEYSPIRKQRALSEIANQVRDGEMPLRVYLRLHPEAKLSEADAQAIFNWTQTERIRLITGNR